MSSKRFSSLGVMIVLLVLSLTGAGCATTRSQNAQYKPHKPQMITTNGPEEVGECPFAHKFNRGFDLSDDGATVIAILGTPLRMLVGNSWKP